jgi:hypothetical protein
MSATKRQPAAGRKPVEGAPQRPLAGFSAMEARAVDAESWPVHDAMWLAPQLRAAPPASTGLRVERHHRTAAPDFVRASVVPADGASLIVEPHAAAPQARRALPESGLAPMGWDSRVEGRTGLRKEERK